MSYKLIQTTAFSAVTTVHFYEETIAHVNEQHPEVKVELPCIYQAVEKCIQDPTHIEKSYSNSFVYVDEKSTDASGSPLRVPVKVIGETTSARVKTVLFAEGNTTPNVVWRKPE